MKPTLTAADASGWYLCQLECDMLDRTFPVYWDGRAITPTLCGDHSDDEYEIERFTNFRRLVEASAPSPAAADEPIVVGGKVCKFHWHSGDGWSIWDGSEHLTSQGWRWAPTKDAPSFETLQAARDFARACAAK